MLMIGRLWFVVLDEINYSFPLVASMFYIHLHTDRTSHNIDFDIPVMAHWFW